MAIDGVPPEDQAPPSRAEIYERMDRSAVVARRAERELLRGILECDRHDLWTGHGARSHAEFLAGRYGISQFKARRWIGAAYALEHLPHVSHALESGVLNLDKTVELSRFATAKTEAKLVKWARKVNPSTVMQRANEETRISPARVRDAHDDRSLGWWWHADGKGLQIEGRLPTIAGEMFISAIDRLMEDATPSDPGSDPDVPVAPTLEQRRADALALLCSAQIANDQDPARAQIVIHAPYEVMVGTKTAKNATTESGEVLDARTVQQLACDARIEVVLYSNEGEVVGIGRASRDAPRWLRRQVMRRHRHACSFPGCNKRRFLDLHHILWWRHGGETNLDNLIPVCDYHHTLIHEYNWNVALECDEAVWFRPGGKRYEPGPVPPPEDQLPAPPEPTAEPSSAPWPEMFHLLQVENSITRDNATLRLLKLGLRERELV